MAELQYEPTTDARPVITEYEGDITRIVVRHGRFHGSVPRWVQDLDVLSVVWWPTWWLGSAVAGLITRRPVPPRATFEITALRFRLTLYERSDEPPLVLDVPREAVLEARSNRYSRGLWLNIAHQVKDTFLADLPRPTIGRLESALAEVLAMPAPPSE